MRRRVRLDLARYGAEGHAAPHAGGTAIRRAYRCGLIRGGRCEVRTDFGARTLMTTVVIALRNRSDSMSVSSMSVGGGWHEREHHGYEDHDAT